MANGNGVIVTCPDCGVEHEVNHERRKRPRYTGRCRDCYVELTDECTYCGQTFKHVGLPQHQLACKREAEREWAEQDRVRDYERTRIVMGLKKLKPAAEWNGGQDVLLLRGDVLSIVLGAGGDDDAGS